MGLDRLVVEVVGELVWVCPRGIGVRCGLCDGMTCCALDVMTKAWRIGRLLSIGNKTTQFSAKCVYDKQFAQRIVRPS